MNRKRDAISMKTKKMRKTTEKMGKSPAPKGEEEVLMCE
jgi:hypothetical protein